MSGLTTIHYKDLVKRIGMIAGKLGRMDLPDEVSDDIKIQINSMSKLETTTTNGIITLDARNSTTNGAITGANSGEHTYQFNGLMNIPKLDGGTTPLSLEAGSNVIIADDVISKSVGNNSWNASAYSEAFFDPLKENFAVSYLVESVDGTIREMGGLDDNAKANNSYSSLEYAIYQVGNYIYGQVYEKGRSVAIPNYSNIYLQVGDRLGVKIENNTAYYFHLRGDVETIFYTSQYKAKNKLQFKAVLNRGNTSSGASVIGGVVEHSETRLDSFNFRVQGIANELISEADKSQFQEIAGLDVLNGSTYAKIDLQKQGLEKLKDGNGDPLDLEVIHDYRGLINQTIFSI